MGPLNDIRTHRNYSKSLEAGRPAAPDDPFVPGYVTGEEQSDVGALLKSARKIGTRLAYADRFWN